MWWVEVGARRALGGQGLLGGPGWAEGGELDGRRLARRALRRAPLFRCQYGCQEALGGVGDAAS